MIERQSEQNSAEYIDADQTSREQELEDALTRMKQERWDELLKDEAEGKVPEGVSIVDLHNEFAAELDGLINQHKRHEAERTGRKQDATHRIYDAKLDMHLQQQGTSAAADVETDEQN